MTKLGYLGAVCVLAAFAITAILYPQLPEIVASHWGSQGEVNGYMTRFWGAFLLPIISAGLFVLFLFLPRIDPLRNNIKQFRATFDGFVVLILAVMLYIHLLTLAWNLGHQFNFVRAIVPAFAVLFFGCGILVGRAKRNWFIGIRTPWTMSNDHVWEETHRLGKKLFIASGILSLVGLFFPTVGIWFVIVPVVLSSLVSVVYSYVVFKRDTKSGV